MDFRGNVRPGKAASVLGVLGGVLFLILGVVIVIPTFGLFGVIWTLFALITAGFYGYNLMSQSGSSLYQVDVSPMSPGAASPDAAATDPASRLRRLDQMLDEGLITTEEHQVKRAAILAEPW
ncbi:MAG: hypothetical protein WKF46_08005 [Candidatus Limnocylindrales bacterium]